MRKVYFLFILCLLLSPPMFSVGKLNFSFSTGYFYPSQREFRDIYGIGNPLSLQISLRLKRNLYISSGYEYTKIRGTAIGEGEDIYPLRFKISSFPLAIFYRFSFKRLFVSPGFGFIRGYFKEEWETLPLYYSNSKTGYMAFTNFEFKISKNFLIFWSVRVESLRTESSSLSKSINLGGIKTLAGFSFYFL
ncbi:MAG: hypothetical protein ACUVUG_10260 [Candidatus Aminicenantia bacterium]